jgi:hypothetical protein
VEQELLTLQEHLSSPSVISGDRVTESLALYACFVDCRLSYCPYHFLLMVYIIHEIAKKYILNVFMID